MLLSDTEEQTPIIFSATDCLQLAGLGLQADDEFQAYLERMGGFAAV